VQRWLGELALALRNETYRPDPKGGDRSSTIRQTLPKRSANDPRPPPPSKEQQRADAPAAFIAWRAKQAAEPQ
jgi:hypothetical protein